MSELSNFLVESIMGESVEMENVIVVYSGRFQPFHKGHFATYQNLTKKFGKDNVYIATSNKTDNQKSPFNFQEKKTIMTKMFGIPSNKIVQVKNPYAPSEILSRYDAAKTGFITVVGEKDEQRLGGNYFTPYKGKVEFGYLDKGYVYASPAQSNPISGTDVRNWLGKGTEEEKKEGFLKAYPKFDPTVFKFITLKLSKMNESITKSLNEVKWEDSTYDKCMLGKLPLSLNIVKKLVDPIRVVSLHATDIENLPKVASLQGTKKSISTFTQTTKWGKLVQGKGMHTKGGIIVALSGTVLAQSIMDLWTEPDRQGRRWVNPGTVIADLGREQDVVFNFAPELKKYKEEWMKNMYDKPATNQEKAEFIKKYYDAAERYMLSKKKEFQDKYLNSNGLYYDSDWNEVVLTQIKIEGILVVPSLLKVKTQVGSWTFDREDKDETENTIKQLKQKYKNVVVADNESDIQNFIKNNGGTIKEDINLDVNVGDTLLMGKFKNKKVVVKDIGEDEHGMPTINGKKATTFRIPTNESSLGGYQADRGEPETGYVADGQKRLINKAKPEPWFKQGGYKQIDVPKGDWIRGKGKDRDKDSTFRKVYYKVTNMETSDLNPAKDPHKVEDWKEVKPKKKIKKPKRFWEDTEMDTQLSLISEEELNQIAEEYITALDEMGLPGGAGVGLSLPGGYINGAPKADDVAKVSKKLKNKGMSGYEEVDEETILEYSGNGAFYNDGNATTGTMWNADWDDYNNAEYYLDNLEGWCFYHEDPSEYEKKRAVDQKLPTDDQNDGKTDKYNRILKYNFPNPADLTEMAEMAKSDLDQVEKYADQQLSPEDIELGRETDHFFQRLNDPRNGKQISAAELTGFFKRLAKNKKKFLDFVKQYKEFVVKDKRTNINIPFMSVANKLIAKTIMRKDDFKSSTPVYVSEQSLSEITKGIYGKKLKINGDIVELEVELLGADNKTKEFITKVVHIDKKYQNKFPIGSPLRVPARVFRLPGGGWYKVKHSAFENVNESKDLLVEGGAYGHMHHPFDIEMNLTFGDLKNIVKKALTGDLDVAREKTDGQALAISWVNGRLVAARNKSHLKNKGEGAMTIGQVADKFAGRGGLTDAYNFAMNDLSKAIGSLSEPQRKKIFNDGSSFMNLEVIYPTSVNVIPYNQPLLVFHGTFDYDNDGNITGENQQSARILAGMIKQINANVQSKYTIQGPPMQKLPKSDNLSKLQSKYMSMISKLQSEFGLSDKDGVADYHQAWWSNFVDKNAKGLDAQEKIGLVKRWAFGDKGFRIATIQDPKLRSWADNTEKKDQAKIAKDNLMKFEEIFLGVGADVLSFMESVLTANPTEATKQMVARLHKTVEDVKKLGDPKKLDKLKLELQRLQALGGFEKIVPNEGIVFVYNGNTYKLTGAFAPLNQILGLFYE